MKCNELQIGDWVTDNNNHTLKLLEANRWEVHSYTPFIRYFYAKNDSRRHLLWSHGTLPVWLAYGEANDGVFSHLILPCKYVHHINYSRYDKISK